MLSILKDFYIHFILNQYHGDIMRSFLINKNLSVYYWLRKRIGKTGALRVASALEKVILIFGREQIGSRA